MRKEKKKRERERRKKMRKRDINFQIYKLLFENVSSPYYYPIYKFRTDRNIDKQE